MAKYKTTIRIGAVHYDITVGSYLHEDIARPSDSTGEWLHPWQMRERLTTLAAFICHTHGIKDRPTAHAPRVTHPPRVYKRPNRSPHAPPLPQRSTQSPPLYCEGGRTYCAHDIHGNEPPAGMEHH